MKEWLRRSIDQALMGNPKEEGKPSL